MTTNVGWDAKIYEALGGSYGGEGEPISEVAAQGQFSRLDRDGFWLAANGAGRIRGRAVP